MIPPNVYIYVHILSSLHKDNIIDKHEKDSIYKYKSET